MRDSGRLLWSAAACVVLFASIVWAEGKPDIEAVRQRVRQKNHTFRVGPNPATEFTLEQLCGTKVPAGFGAKAAAAAPIQGASALPQSFDWRKLEGCSSVKNQGGCGSCWAFAAMGAVESQYLIRAGVELDFSEQWLVSCTDAGTCNGGWYGRAMDYMVSEKDPYDKIGAPLEEMFPYEAKDINCSVPSEAQRYLITDWEAVQQDIDAMKQAIQTYGPIAVTIYADDLFQCYVGGVFNAHADGPSNHAVVLVGWDDTQGESGIWYLRNSWGPGWGENGYMRIEYGRNNVGGAPCYATLTPDNEPNELNVPTAAFPTLRAALDAAGDGDTILLAPGVYTGPDNTNLRFGGKAVTVRSENPADTAVVAATVIDCQGSTAQPCRAFIFDGYEGAGTVLNGITIRNGYPRDNGGAIYCYYSNPTFKNCVFENNAATGYKKSGGAIALYNSSPRIVNCRIQNNSASSYGGGISCRDSSAPWISGCDILNNTAGTEGGGVYGWVNAQVVLENTVIAGNHAGESGGGLFFFECTPDDANSPPTETVVLSAEAGSPDPNAPVVAFCTLADNTTDGLGGGIFCMDSIVHLHNSILWNNQGGESLGGQIALIDDSLDGTTLKVQYCDVTGQDQGHLVDTRCTLEWGAGNFAADPLFADAGQQNYYLKSAAGRWDPATKDWVLDDGGNYDPADDENSPCIDAGNPAGGVGNELRCHGDRINIGAYGGTERASRSAAQKCCMQCLPADFNCDCKINMEDLMTILEDWLECNLLPRYYCDEG